MIEKHVFSNEFLMAYKFFKSHNNDLPVDISTKLVFLGDILIKTENPWLFESEKDIEIRKIYENLKEIPLDYLTYIFVNQVIMQFPDTNFDIRRVEAEYELLELRSQTLKIWRNTRFLLNFSLKRLRVFKTSNEFFDIELHNYAVRWIGKHSDDRYIFSLDSFDPNHKYRNLLIGSQKVLKSSEFFQNIKFTINSIDYSPLFYKKSFDDYAQRGMRHCKSLIKGFQEHAKINDHFLSVKRMNTSNNINKSNDLMRKTQSQLFDENKKEMINILDLSNLDEDEKLIVEKNEKFIENDPNYIYKGYKLDKNLPDGIDEVLKNIRKNDLFDTKDYRLFENHNEVCIYHHNIEPFKYKVLLNITTGHTIKEITAFLLQPKLLHKTLISMKILNMISEDCNTAIIHELYKKHGFLYLDREFICMRTWLQTENSLVIIKKSIDFNENIYSSYMSFPHKIRGNIENTVYFIEKQDKTYRFVLDITVNNGGFLTETQNILITLEILRDFYEFNSLIDKTIPKHHESLESISSVKDFLHELKRKSSNSNSEVRNNAKNEEFIMKIDKTATISIDEENRKKMEKREKTSKNEHLLIKDESELDNYRQNKFLIEDPSLKHERYHSYDINLPNPDDDELIFPMPVDKTTKELLLLIKSPEFISKILSFSKNNKNTFKKPHPVFNQQNILKTDWKVSPTGEGLIYMNKKVLKTQKNMLTYLLKRLGSNILQGKSISSISFPIDLYEPRSELEKYTNDLSLGPYFLEKASLLDDSIEQLKLIITYFIASMHLNVSQKKPFVSRIGETLQAKLKDYEIYFEQIKQDPITSYFLMKGEQFDMYGYYEIMANLNANSCLCRNKGKITVSLHRTKHRITIFFPFFLISGTAFGKRIFNAEGKMYFSSKENLLFGEISFNPDKKSLIGGIFSKKGQNPDNFTGGIYKVNDEFFKKFLIDPLNFLGISSTSFPLLHKIEGIWHQYLNIDEKLYWKIGSIDPATIEYVEHALPSDSQYREDIILWKLADNKAQILMEDISMEEKKQEELRKKQKKLRKKLK